MSFVKRQGEETKVQERGDRLPKRAMVIVAEPVKNGCDSERMLRHRSGDVVFWSSVEARAGGPTR